MQASRQQGEIFASQDSIRDISPICHIIVLLRCSGLGVLEAYRPPYSSPTPKMGDALSNIARRQFTGYRFNAQLQCRVWLIGTGHLFLIHRRSTAGSSLDSARSIALPPNTPSKILNNSAKGPFRASNPYSHNSAKSATGIRSVTVEEFAASLRLGSVRHAEQWNNLLEVISEIEVGNRPGRQEKRELKRRQQNDRLTTGPRNPNRIRYATAA